MQLSHNTVTVLYADAEENTETGKRKNFGVWMIQLISLKMRWECHASTRLQRTNLYLIEAQ